MIFETKYRIVETNGWFYPEMKTFFRWVRFHNVTPIHESCITILGTEGIGFQKLSHAKATLQKFIESKTSVIHEVK